MIRMKNKQIFAAAAAAALSLTMLPIREAKAGWVTLTLRNKELNEQHGEGEEVESDQLGQRAQELAQYILDLSKDDELTMDEKIQKIKEKADDLEISGDVEEEEDSEPWKSMIHFVIENESEDEEEVKKELRFRIVSFVIPLA